MELNSLVNKAKKGNWQAYLDLVFMKKDVLYHKALMIVKNEQDAADAIQDAIIKGYDNIDQLQHAEYFHTWITRIVIHTCIDILRKSTQVVCLDNTILENIEDESSNDIDQILDLKNKLNCLPEKFRTVLVLRYFEEMKVNEIAQILNLPEGTIKSRIYHGLLKMKNSMEGDIVNEM